MTWRESIRWALPPRWLLVLASATYGATRVAEWLVALFPTTRGSLAFAGDGTARIVVIVWFCVTWGLYRAVAVHPRASRDYWAWLATTPWNGRRPLPFGRVHLTWLDMLAPAGLMLIECWNPAMDVRWIPLAVMLAYVVAATYLLSLVHAGGYTYALLWGLGGVVLCAHHHGAMLLIATGLCVVTWFGVRRSLLAFPWEGASLQDIGRGVAQRRKRSGLSAGPGKAGWSFEQLAPMDGGTREPLHVALAASALVGWWCFVVITVLYRTTWQADLQPLWLMFLALAAMVRFAVHRNGTSAPISLWGRFRTMHWVIPRHDKIYVAPVGTLVVGILLITVVHHLQIPSFLAIPAVTMIALLMLVRIGPSRQTWLLTGAHHLQRCAGRR